MTSIVIRQHRCEAIGDVSHQLASAFEQTKAAVGDGVPVALVVHAPDLLGQGDLGDAAVATGFLGLMRAIVFEARSKAWVVNVIAVDPEAPNPVAVIEMLETAGLSGQVITTTKTGVGRLPP